MKNRMLLSLLFIILTSIFVNAQNNLAGKYQYSYRHETGRDSFVYDLRRDGKVFYASDREGEGREEQKGSWRWDATKKLVYVTLTDSEGTKETHTFAVVRGNLKMRSNSSGWLFLNDKVFRRLKN